MEVTVSSMFTTTPRRRPCEGQVPTPTMFSFPSRSSSPTRTQIFVVPTSIPTITCSCMLSLLMGGTIETHYEYMVARVRATTHHYPTPATFSLLQYLIFKRVDRT